MIRGLCKPQRILDDDLFFLNMFKNIYTMIRQNVVLTQIQPSFFEIIFFLTKPVEQIHSY